ncbi:hypothetical protein PN499_22580 [Kamptonema animale CS-326]|jgi:hypothetical protein|uniref:hypothetical protein n=1 Tax=Kamptonema animale TaxID=92934 RepID=UPI00232D961D|nr:hypothetical protein [Kamptonema animale]MDB9513989.1 hypothetical protein [Kamptonema animale CS-326]
MKKLILSGLLAVFVATTALGNTTTPTIEPIRRMSSPEIRETIAQPTTYIFEGTKGRELTLSLWAGSLTAELFSPSGQRLGIIQTEVSQWVGVLPESGLYRVRITPKKQTTSFVLERDFKAIWSYKPERQLPMARGAKDTSIELKLSAYEIQPLTIQAKVGQTMTVTAKDVDVAIESPSGELLDQGNGEALAKLPQSGVYRILIVASKSIQTSVKVTLR